MNFVKRATPIGSNLLAKVCKNRLSSATIRNIMTSLESKGLVTQPHTSAGRVPTDMGYRYYVNGLMKLKKLSRTEKQKIDNDLSSSQKNVELILENACNVLSEISNQLGVVLSPIFYQGIFEKLEMISLSEHKLLIVISVSSGLIKKIILEAKSNLSGKKLYETERILNERLSGLSLRLIRNSIKKRMRDVNYGDKKLINQVASSADKIFSTEEDSIYFKGTSNILVQPEFSNKEHLIKLINLIDNKKILIQNIKNSIEEDKRISITIGSENRAEFMKNCSLISTTYHLGDITGTLGIIGPTRMNYEKVFTLVDYIAQGVNNLFR